MHGLLFVGLMFIAKVVDNALSTAKTILIQRSRWIIAGVIVMLSDFIYFWVTKNIVSAESSLMIIIVWIALCAAYAARYEAHKVAGLEDK